MQNVEWVMEWVIPLRLLRLLEHLAVLITIAVHIHITFSYYMVNLSTSHDYIFVNFQTNRKYPPLPHVWRQKSLVVCQHLT